MTTTEKDLSDFGDYKKILEMLIKQAMYDYVKLQHPRMRRKPIMEAAFQQAVDLFWDPTYRVKAIQNSDGEDASVEDILKEILDKDEIDLEKIKEKLVKDALVHWSQQEVNILTVPRELVVEGHVYNIFPAETEEQNGEIDYDNFTIYIDQADNSKNQELMCRICFALLLEHCDIKLKAHEADKLGSAFFRLLRMNDCFVGDLK